MAKRVWVSLPLTTTTDLTDSEVVGFLKGGKKTLEIETGAFITKWLADKSVPFTIDFASSTLDRSLVMAALPGSIQQASKNPVVGLSVPQTEPPTPAVTSADEASTSVELPAVATPAATAKPTPVELPVAEPATKAEADQASAPTAGPNTSTDRASIEIPAAETPAMAEPPAPALAGQVAVPEEQNARSKRVGRPRAKGPKAGPSEVA